MGAAELIEITDPASGLDAVVCIDSTALGPAAGGVRTRAYADRASMVADVRSLAAAMTVKCALAGLDAGGGKAVVREHPGLDRPRAFARLGEAIAGLGGRFRTAGDLGTTEVDLEAMAAACPEYVHTGGGDLAAAVARGLAACLERAWRSVDGAAIAVQGCGSIGAAVARLLAQKGAHLAVADLDEGRAAQLAVDIGAEVIDAAEILGAGVDAIAPCAAGGVIDEQVAAKLRARVICGGANNLFATEAAERTAIDAGHLVIPDVIASAGAVIDGIGRTVMGLDSRARGALIDRLGDTAAEIVAAARSAGLTPSAMARRAARARIAG